MQVNATGGDGDSIILDASLNAAGTMGVDSAETIFGHCCPVKIFL